MHFFPPALKTNEFWGLVFGPYESDFEAAVRGKKLQGGLKHSGECLDCCHSGKDTAIKLSSKVRHRLAGRTWPDATNASLLACLLALRPSHWQLRHICIIEPARW